jgi:nicotinate phosphoribosyltransferase
VLSVFRAFVIAFQNHENTKERNHENAGRLSHPAPAGIAAAKMADAMVVNPLQSALFTDLYELAMAQAYDAEGMDRQSVFELSFRKLPARRNYVIAAGLDDVLSYLEQLRVSDEDVAYLRGLNRFSDGFLRRLRELRFTGDIHAVPEGTPMFPGEPLLQVVAPILQAQLIETLVLNQVHFQTVIASKAARVITAAAGRQVVDFGSRRAHGADAALKMARACYLAGAAGTSLLLAGKTYGIPVFGTMAHSYIQAHADEAEAFEAFVRLNPDTTVLVDTYDTIQGVQKVLRLSRKLGDRFRLQAIRLDSGDLGELARQARALLDDGGLTTVRIFASSGLDEYAIARLLTAGAPIDGFGVGSNLAVAADAPHLDMVYKLVEYDGRPRTKLSAEKVIYPGRKQIFRLVEGDRMVRDIIGRHDEPLPGEPLLQPVLRGGARLPAGAVPLEEARRHSLRERQRLPEPLQALDSPPMPYRVEVSELLQHDLETLRLEWGAR